MKCPANCTECSSSTTCTGCHSLFSLDNDQCQPIDQCAIPSSSNSKVRHSSCVTCPSDCSFCEDDLHCSVCNPGHFLIDFQCRKCRQNCAFCQSLETCTQCLQGYFLEEGECKQDKLSLRPEPVLETSGSSENEGFT